MRGFPRRRWFRVPLGAAAVIALIILVLYAFGEHYYASPIIELDPSELLTEGITPTGIRHYVAGGAILGWTADSEGYFCIPAQTVRKQEVCVLKYDSGGRLSRNIRLFRADGRRMLGRLRALAVSPSGNRLWVVHEPIEDAPNPLKHEYMGYIVSLCGPDGSTVREWSLNRDDPLMFGAIGEDGAYFVGEAGGFHTYRVDGKAHVDKWSWRGNFMLPWDGASRSIEIGGGLDMGGGVSHREAPGVAAIWKQKPGIPPVKVCETRIPNSHSVVLPFWCDSEGRLYVYQLHGLRAGKERQGWVYEIRPTGSLRQLFHTTDVLGGPGTPPQRIGAMICVGPRDSIYFEAVSYTLEDRLYHVYKAEVMPRWRVWLKKLGIG